MKIECMRIDNWRSFYGSNQIVFSTDPKKNVTLVRAENGVGKTSLLAALNWCLFGILPDESDFQNPKSLLNNTARSKDGVKHTKVELEFEHREKHYKASRTYDQISEKMNALRLVEIRDGVEAPLPSNINPDRFINSILPKEMAPHFFFYGEATSKYADEAGAQAFGLAVKNILGATAATMALSDLQRAFKDYSREAADNSNDEAISIQAKIDKIELARTGLDEESSRASQEEKAAEIIIDKINKQLLGSEQVKVDQQRRNKLTSDIDSLRLQLERELTSSRKWFDVYGTPLLAQSFVDDVKQLLEKEDTRKKIPGPFNEKFVREVLEDEICICGRPIKVGSDEEVHIKSLLESATDEIMMNRILTTNVAIGKLEEKARNGWVFKQKSDNEQARLHEAIAAKEAELVEISDRLRNNDIKSISEKEEALRNAKAKQREAISRHSMLQRTIESNDRQIDALRREQEKLVRESLAARRFVKRAQLSGALSERLKQRLEEEEIFARIEIKKKIDQIIAEFMRKRLSVKIDANYRVSVKDESGNIAANSTGEKQMLGLAFTGAIADFARDREAEESDILLSGTEAPLVVDSPFGHLDSTYREGVASFLPKMASQVILLLSSSQASNEVLQQLDDRVGSQYVLVRYENSEAGSRQVETAEISGSVVTLTHYSHEFTGTQIVEVD
jgi:DNA sulfur modification protein DndD